MFYFLLFNIPCNFLLRVTPDVPDKRDSGIRGVSSLCPVNELERIVFSGAVVRCELRKRVQGHMSESRSFTESVLSGP